MKPSSLLEKARKNIFDFGCGDASDVVAKLNLQHGLGKVMWVLGSKGIDSRDVVAVTTPDSGITRNKERWQAGFSYGCLVRWPSGKETGRYFAFPQIKPNACGMLVAKIKDIPQISDLCDKLHAIDEKGLRIKGSKIKLNVGVSNHFIELCRVSESNTSGLREGDAVAIIHTSPSECKDMLYNFNSWQSKGGTWEETPLGPLFVLEDEVAKEYLEVYQEVEEFSFAKRKMLADCLFKDFEVISNPTHQGLFGDNEARLGLYQFNDEDELLPVTFRWDINVYLMKPKENISEEILAENGFVSEHNRSTLKGLNVLPHGGGYQIPFKSQGWRVMKNGSKNLFSNHNGKNEFVFSSPSEIPYHYRGLEIIEKIEELKLATMAAKLRQEYTLKY